MPPAKKKCRTCNRVKGKHLYYRRKSNKDGLSGSCKSCIQSTGKAAAHARHIQETYGITYDNYEEQLARQGGTCYICRGGTSKRHFAVDHDHKTGEPRGLLCGTCNNVLGKFRDDPARFRRAAAYLDNPPFRKVLGERDWSAYQDDIKKPAKRRNRRRRN